MFFQFVVSTGGTYTYSQSNVRIGFVIGEEAENAILFYYISTRRIWSDE